MGIRYDIAMMERHSLNGTLREHMEGTGPILGAHERVTDPSAKRITDNYQWIAARGD